MPRAAVPCCRPVSVRARGAAPQSLPMVVCVAAEAPQHGGEEQKESDGTAPEATALRQLLLQFDGDPEALSALQLVELARACAS